MAHPIYYVPAGDVLPIFFDTFDGGTGASITMTGIAVTDIEIYKDGSTTQRASDAGYTLLDTDGIDFDGITGIHGFSIDTGDNTDASFYTVGAWFTVVVSSVTVDAQTVNFIAAQFRIMAAEGVAGVPDVNTTHVSDTAQTAGDIMADTNDIQSRLPAALVSGRMDASVGAMAANVITAAATAADFGAEIADAVWDEDATGHQTQGTFGQAIGDPAADANTIYGAVVTAAAGATIAADIIAVKAETASILTDTAEIGAAGAGLTVLATQASVDTIDGIVDSILADTGTDGVVVAAGSKTGYTLSAAGLADFFDTDTGTTYASAVAGSVVAEIADNAGGSALTAAAIADAVWDEAQADHVAAGSFGEVATEVASILVDTAEIGAAGAGLTAINLPDQTMNITGNLTGNVSGSVGSVTAAVTVDDTTPVEVNVKKINDVTIVGDGSGTPFNV